MHSFQQSGGFLTFRDEPILNAEICQIDLFSHVSGKGYCVRITVKQGTEMRVLPLIDSADLDHLQLGKLEPRLVCIDSMGRPTDKRVIAFLQLQISELLRSGSHGIAFTRHGWETLPDGRHVYVAGDRVIGNLGAYDCIISPAVACVHLPDEVEIPDQALIRAYLNKLRRDPNILIMLSAHLVRSLLCSVFEEAGFPARYIVYLDGKYQSGKTTAATNFCMVYNQTMTGEPAFMSRVLGTCAASRDFLANSRDVVTLADDVCTSSDAETQRKSKATAAYIIRFAADRIPEYVKSGGRIIELRNHSGVVITGELPMNQASDISRCAAVWVDHQMRNGERDDRIVTAAAMARFLKYFTENYDNLSAEIRTQLCSCNPASSRDSGPRQQAILLELSCAFQLLLDFAAEIGVLNPIELESWRDMMQLALSFSLRRNNDLLQQFERISASNVSKIIFYAIDSKDIRLAKSIDEFRISPKSYDGFKRKKIVFVRQQALAELLTDVTGRQWTVNEVGQRLRMTGLVEVGAENHTAKAKFPEIGRFVPLDRRILKQQANPEHPQAPAYR